METMSSTMCTPMSQLTNNTFYFTFNNTGDSSLDNGYHHGSLNLSQSNYDVTRSSDVTSLDYEYIEWILYSCVTVAIAILGLLGNILNLIVLTQKKIKISMDRMER